jgi:hypothetical protein
MRLYARRTNTLSEHGHVFFYFIPSQFSYEEVVRHGKVFFSYALIKGDLSVPLQTLRTSNAYMTSIHPEIDDFRMERSALSSQQSAKNLVIMKFLLKAESETLIALIRK